jgi:hypothetical protein
VSDSLERFRVEMLERLAQRDEREDQFREEFRSFATRMDESLNGNGRPGMKQRLAVVEEKVSAHAKAAWLIGGATISIILKSILG